MSRTLIVARMIPQNAREVSRIFAESDAGDLPHLLGVRERHLFRYCGLYMHMIDAAPGIGEKMQELRGNAEYQDLTEKLAPLLLAYDPVTWKSMRDSVAVPFYSWQNELADSEW